MTTAGFYAWRRRGESAHAGQDRLLTREIERLFSAHSERYGSTRLYRLLHNAGWIVSRRRVARLMRAAGLRAKAVQGYRAKGESASSLRATSEPCMEYARHHSQSGVGRRHNVHKGRRRTAGGVNNECQRN